MGNSGFWCQEMSSAYLTRSIAVFYYALGTGIMAGNWIPGSVIALAMSISLKMLGIMSVFLLFVLASLPNNLAGTLPITPHYLHRLQNSPSRRIIFQPLQSRQETVFHLYTTTSSVQTAMKLRVVEVRCYFIWALDSRWVTEDG